MTRGRHAVKASAREERDAAIKEARTLGNEVDRLVKLTDRLDKENLAQQARHIEAMASLRIELATAVTPEVERLRAENRQLTERLAEQRASLGRELALLIRKDDAIVFAEKCGDQGMGGIGRLAKMFDLTLGEWLDAAGVAHNRRARRATSKSASLKAEISRTYGAIGF